MNVWFKLPGKKFVSSKGNVDFSLIFDLNGSLFSSAQGFIEIEPKLVWNIPV